MGVKEGATLGGCGRWRSIKRMEVGVRKVEMWELENWSMRLRYLDIAILISTPLSAVDFFFGNECFTKLLWARESIREEIEGDHT